MAERVNTVIVGGGQAGLSLSYYLTRQGRDHVVLEKGRTGEAWRSQRWDSFALVLPNWTLRLPGFHYAGEQPHGFMSREELVAHLDRWVGLIGAPVRCGVRVTSISKMATDDGYRVETDQGIFEATNVVVATGTYQQARQGAGSTDLAPGILQIHCSQYRNPDALPPGAVLVVGSGQSGCQIAEELYETGRRVYLSTGSTGRIPRRYRGKDAVWWLNETGFLDRPVDKLPSPKARFAGAACLSGKNGGHTLNLHKFARDGAILLGHLRGGQGTKIVLAEDLKENLTKTDEFAANFLKGVDEYVQKTGLDVPEDMEHSDYDYRYGYDAPVLSEVDCAAAGISAIIWAAGFKFDFSWIHLPVLDEYGYPVQRRGVTEFPGLYFLGLHWLHTNKSGLFLGVGDDAEYVAGHIEGRRTGAQA